MGTMISLSMVQVGVFAFLACLCGAIYAGLQKQSSLAWLAAALSCGALCILLISRTGGSALQWIAITVMVPGAYLCLAQSVRIIVGQQRQYWPLIGAIVGLTAIAVLLAFAGIPFLYQTLPFQLACGLAVAESLVRLVRSRQRSPLDLCLILTLTGLAAMFMARIPLYLILFEPGSHYAVVRASAFQHTTLAISALLGPTTAFLLLVKVIHSVIVTYRIRSERDAMTGLLNRYGFDLAVAREGTGSGAVILCDIDHFKRVNDRYGHAVGDDVLCAFAGILAHSGHRAGRMGGEEFALLLPHCTTEDAAGIAEMIRQRFFLGFYPGIAADHRLSASFGIADYGPGIAPKNAFIRADAALYRAKKTGRNRVLVADDLDMGTDPRLRAA